MQILHTNILHVEKEITWYKTYGMKIYGLKTNLYYKSSFGIKYLRHEDISSEVDDLQAFTAT